MNGAYQFKDACQEQYDKENNKNEQSLKKKRIYSVAVEGNIGSGKTTFLNYFKKYSNVQVLVEPVEKWKNIRGFNSLDMMYKDTTRWSSAFQSYVTLTMLQNHHILKDKINIRMTERSVYSGRYCFIENLHQNELMPHVDYAMLSEWYDWIKTNAEAELDLIAVSNVKNNNVTFYVTNSINQWIYVSFILMHVDLVYLKASPETCKHRIIERNRHEEEGVPIDYLRTLDKLHNDWLIKKSHGQLPAKVLVINTDCSKDDVIKQIHLLEKDIMCGVTPQS